MTRAPTTARTASPPGHPAPEHQRGCAGSATAELTLLVPLLLVLLLFVVAVGRLAGAHQQVTGVAHQAARAASLATTAAAATALAAQTATQAATDARVGCTHLDVHTDTTAFTPGGQVSVTIRCTVTLSDLALLRMPGTTTVTATSTEPIDLYRSVNPS